MEAWMKKPLTITWIAIILGLGGIATTEAQAPGSTGMCGRLTSTKLRDASVVSASLESVGAISVCKAEIVSKPTPDSAIHIEFWIPEGDAWNGRFVQLGNGGYAGRIRSDNLRTVAASGYAVAGTDDGHQSSSNTDASFAMGHPETLIDYGWRAVKETTDTAKALIVAAKSKKPVNSYFVGCSDGGREALIDAQRFPQDFDGIVAGAPGNYQARLMTMRVGMYQILARPGGFLDKDHLQLVQRAVLAKCGNPKLGFVQDAEGCRFDPAELLCKGDQSSGCLTNQQVASMRAVYAGWHDPRSGALRYAGYEPGAEGQPVWVATIFGDGGSAEKSAGYEFAASYLRYLLYGDLSYDLRNFDLGAEADKGLTKLAPILDGEDPDLSKFRDHGGKLIQYHGWNDQNVPTRSSVAYFHEVQHKMGDSGNFYRLFLVPGMLHCSGGLGPNKVDWLALLDDWVRNNKAPGKVVATQDLKGVDESAARGITLATTQLVCPYPHTAQLTGADPLVAESYKCVLPPSK
jgi:feruloyl esterase